MEALELLLVVNSKRVVVDSFLLIHHAPDLNSEVLFLSIAPFVLFHPSSLLNWIQIRIRFFIFLILPGWPEA